MLSYQRSSSIYHDGLKDALKIDPTRFNNTEICQCSFSSSNAEKTSRRNKFGSIINIPDPQQGDRWTSLKNELQHWIRELNQQEDKETKKYCESRITRIKDLMRKRGYHPDKLTGQE